MILVTAGIDYTSGWTQVRFPFNRAVVDAVKSIPGARWQPESKAWLLPLDGLAALLHRHSNEIKLEVMGEARRAAPLIADSIVGARPYQIEGAEFLVERGGGILSLAPRLGKTRTSIMAARALAGAQIINTALVVYPNGVRSEWERQIAQWWPGQQLLPILADGQRDEEWNDMMTEGGKQPFRIFGIHYEILTDYLEDVERYLVGSKYVLIADEIHLAKNRKAPRTVSLHTLAHKARARWGLTGTPMRNRSRDLFSIFNFTIPESCGRGYWKWAGTYCNAFQNDQGHWDDFGDSNSDELKIRLAAISYRKTREEVAAHLPKADRCVVPCNIAKSDLAKYKKLEKELASKISRALCSDEMSPGDRDAIEALTKITTKAKIPAVVERAVQYAAQGLDVIVFCHHHVTIDALDTEWKSSQEIGDVILENSIIPMFARGYDLPPKRQAEIAAWKKQPKGGSVLFANTMSVNVGIDLSKADVALFVELEWVPADLRQAEDRLVDVHLGSRTAPPIYEYATVPGTVDEDMTAALLSKFRSIDAVVGTEADSAQLAGVLRESGTAGAYAGLAATDESTVQAALIGLRDRWMNPVSEVGGSKSGLVEDMAGTDWDTESTGTTEEHDDSDIPF